ncbi:hypothetical protein [Paenibacillus puldeungensis]
MADFTSEELGEAHRAILSLRNKSEKASGKLLLTIYLDRKVKSMHRTQKNWLLDKMLLKYTPPLRLHPAQIASFLSPQVMWSAVHC